jgi:hypothetical protein
MSVFSASHLSVKLKSKAAESKELISRLKTLHVSLSKLSQEEEEREQIKNLKVIAGQLVSPRLLSHTDKSIRVLVCCCIVDILRIFVPESPFRYRKYSFFLPSYIYANICACCGRHVLITFSPLYLSVRRNYVKYLTPLTHSSVGLALTSSPPPTPTAPGCSTF